MFKLRYLPQYILVGLMLALMAIQSWTFYLGTTDVTFERLIGAKPYSEIKDMSLRRYKKGEISPHLFTIKTDNQEAIIKEFKKDCKIEKIEFKTLPKVVKDTDKEMVDVIKKSPFIYLSSNYNLQNPKDGRMCLLFRDKDSLYLFINGNLPKD